jgi:hypothetical protein
LFSCRQLRNATDLEEFAAHVFKRSDTDKDDDIELVLYGNIKFQQKEVRERRYQHLQHWSYLIALEIKDTKQLNYATFCSYLKFKVLERLQFTYCID